LPGHSNTKGIDRVIDANLNRTHEGLRVCEEIARFILNSRVLTSELKNARHQVSLIARNERVFANLIRQRKSLQDPGKEIYGNELKRKDYRDIFFANIQRVKESMRVLEEFSKLGGTASAIRFKRIRYQIYEIEKKIAQRLVHDTA
jgi:thiamine-phosphate pyrophosphorylase